jgi:hypothetical protein
MCADDGGVDHDTFFVDLYSKCPEDGRPVTTLRPVREPVEDRLPGAKALWEIAPRYARFRAVEHRIDKPPVVEFGLRATFLGDGDAYHRPLRIGQSMAERHAQL